MSFVIRCASRRAFAMMLAFASLTASGTGHLSAAEEPADAQPTRLAPATDFELFPAGTSQVYAEPGVYQLVSCNGCGNFASACSCGTGAGSGETYGYGPYRNLFWCNPRGEEFIDPCDRNGCRNCAWSRPPLFYASAEMLALARDQNDELAFQTLGQGGPVVLETGDFRTEFDAGMRLTLGTTLTDLYRLEGVYTGSYEWQTFAAVRNQAPNSQGTFGNLFSPFSNFGTPVGFIGTDFNEYAAIEFESQFSSAELNLRRRLIIPMECWPPGRTHCVTTSCLVGVRYLKLEEQLGYVTSSTVPAGGSVNRADVAVDNDMIGFQIGMMSQFMSRGRGWVDFEVKGGVYHNEASLAAAFENTDRAGAVFADFAGTDERNRTAFMGELSLNYNYPVTERCTFRVGYNAMWLTGVALAPQNLSTDLNIQALGPAQVDHSGEVVYHGPNAGIVYAY
jgi:hypothetical protein